VARQYSGTAGRIENSQVGVFLAYGSGKGRALIDRELYLPKEWTSNRERCRTAGIGDDVEFTTKPDLGLRMLKRAVESGIPFGWVTADEVCGQTSRIRVWLEEPTPPAPTALLAQGLTRNPRMAHPRHHPESLVASLDGQGPALRPPGPDRRGHHRPRH
jgi:SRSO17 transposase